MTDFKDIKLNKQLFQAIENLGFDKQTPIQEHTFSKILSGNDLVGIAQTGTGKTIAYCLPLLQELIFSNQNNPRIFKYRCVMADYLIAPSILAANFARLGEEVDSVLASGGDIIHFDVMDNHFVPNLTIGPMVCKALRDHGVTAPIDVHLMVSPVDEMIRMFADAGADYITFHPEASTHVDRSLQLIRDLGCKAGLVINPATGLDTAQWVMDKMDMLVLMSVNPGFGGQKFIPSTIDKLKQARSMIDSSGHDIRLEIDGGVGVNNIAEIAAAGADTFVAGSAIFSQPDYADIIAKLRAELASVR